MRALNHGRSATVLLGLMLLASSGHAAKVYNVHADHLGAAQVLTDENHRIVWSAEYQPFGQVIANEDPDGDGEIVEFNLRFPGQYYDKSTGVAYNYYRDYDAGLGRYIQSDPIGLRGGLNTYGYVSGNPVAFFDPFGLVVTGSWIEYPRLDQSTLNASYTGWEPTLGFDKYVTLLMVRLNFQVSGDIVASVRCEDDCDNKEWEESYDVNLSTDEHIDLGVNLPATAGSTVYGPRIGAIINAIVIDLKLNEGLQGLGNNLEVKAALLSAYGADLICQKGWPKI